MRSTVLRPYSHPTSHSPSFATGVSRAGVLRLQVEDPERHVQRDQGPVVGRRHRVCELTRGDFRGRRREPRPTGPRLEGPPRPEGRPNTEVPGYPT